MSFSAPRILRVLRVAALLAAALAGPSGCEPPPLPKTVTAAGTATAPVPVPAPVSITLLYTSDEHGWLAPLVEKGVAHGGAAEILSHWIAREGHCPGPLPDAWPGPPP